MSGPRVSIFTDGACSGNPGPGGWAAILRAANGAERELTGGDRATTNNRMEMLGAAGPRSCAPRTARSAN